LPCAATSASAAPASPERPVLGLGGFYYPDDGTLLLQINEDGIFTATMTPADAANNIAKASSCSGTVSERGRLVVFHTSQGPWDSLLRSGDILYGSPART
jgi:hypothetical protein